MFMLCFYKAQYFIHKLYFQSFYPEITMLHYILTLFSRSKDMFHMSDI